MPIFKKSVLIVDDERMILTLVGCALERAGYTVATAESALKALEVIRCCETPLDLILTDVQMPGMNGLELARRIRDYRKEIAVVFMTGFVMDTEIPNDTRIIRKPFRIEELIIRVGEMLNG